MRLAVSEWLDVVEFRSHLRRSASEQVSGLLLDLRDVGVGAPDPTEKRPAAAVAVTMSRDLQGTLGHLAPRHNLERFLTAGDDL